MKFLLFQTKKIKIKKKIKKNKNLQKFKCFNLKLFNFLKKIKNTKLIINK
jgi:hypothetical protein